MLDVADLVPVPDRVDPIAAEPVLVNGLTDYRMLHRRARVRLGETSVVCSRESARTRMLVQLARAARSHDRRSPHRATDRGSPRSNVTPVD